MDLDLEVCSDDEVQWNDVGDLGDGEVQWDDISDGDNSDDEVVWNDVDHDDD
jgi:hypothetical protein